MSLFFQVVSWQTSVWLMVHSYYRGMADESYSQKLFWISNCVVYTAVMIHELNNYFDDNKKLRGNFYQTLA